MRRDKQGLVQGHIKEQQLDGMSHRGSGGQGEGGWERGLFWPTYKRLAFVPFRMQQEYKALNFQCCEALCGCTGSSGDNFAGNIMPFGLVTKFS